MHYPSIRGITVGL